MKWVEGEEAMWVVDVVGGSVGGSVEVVGGSVGLVVVVGTMGVVLGGVL